MSDDQLPLCPECASDLTYESGPVLTCPMCARVDRGRAGHHG
ncbi:hypothetical protein [Janibacter limosus]